MKNRMRNIFTTVSLLGILTFWAPSLSHAQEISCDELKKIEITDSNRETILKKYKDAIYRCAEITREDSLLLTVIELPIIAKHGAVTNTPSKIIGDVIKELYLMKAESEYEDVTKTMAFVFGLCK